MVEILTPEEKAKRNAMGTAHGSATCPVCGDSFFWKAAHGVTYFEGTIELTNERAKTGDRAPTTDGKKELWFVCEECWPKLSIDERIKAFEGMMERRISALRPIIYMLDERHVEEFDANGERKLTVKNLRIEDEADRARYDAQKAALQTEHDTVIAAIKAGA